MKYGLLRSRMFIGREINYLVEKSERERDARQDSSDKQQSRERESLLGSAPPYRLYNLCVKLSGT